MRGKEIGMSEEPVRVWYRLECPAFGKGWNDSCIREASREEIKKYKLDKLNGTLTIGSEPNVIFRKDANKTYLYEIVIDREKNNIKYAQYRLRCAREFKCEYLKKLRKETLEEKKQRQYIKDCRGIDI